MTTILERCLSVIAPHRCLGCSIENNILCDDCSITLDAPDSIGCLACGAPAGGYAECRDCALGYPPKNTPAHLWVAACYGGLAEQAIHLFKFERASAAARPLARLVARQLPPLPAGTLVVPVPTAPSRQRVRGYDHCLLLAKELSRLTGLPYRTPFIRAHGRRQVGASRQQRADQAATAFAIPRPALVQNRRILLLDDVVTTGATVRAAAAVLRRAGAARVDIAAVAHQPSPAVGKTGVGPG